MTERDAVVAEARRWLATPYRHMGHRLGVACDCGGLIAEVGRALGLTCYRYGAYARVPCGQRLRQLCDAHLVAVPPARPLLPGEVLLLTWRRYPTHLALVSRLADGRTGLIHAIREARTVTEHVLTEEWLGRIAARYDYPGVA